MEFLMYYAVFAITTALAALYEIFWPVIKEVRNNHPESLIGAHPALTAFSLTGFAVLVAPMIFLPCVVPKLGARFRHTLYEQLVIQK